MSRIAIIGGSGFLGQALIRALVGAQHDVISISRDLPSLRQAGVEYLDCGYDQFSALGNTYHRCDIIVHLAWDTTPALSAGNPSVEIGANLLPLSRFLETLSADFNGRIVFVSSGGAVYGDGAPLSDAAPALLSEASPLEPVSYYGAAKGAAELFLAAFHRQTGVPVTILRPSNVYGPGQTVKRFFAVIPTLLAALRHNETFRVIGDGSAARDYLYIDDFAQLLNLVVSQSATDNSFGCLNACSGKSTLLIDLIRVAEEVSGKRAQLEFVGVRGSDVGSVRLSAETAKREFGWHAQTALHAGMEQTWHWMLRTGTP